MCCVGGAQDEARMKGFIFISLGGGGDGLYCVMWVPCAGLVLGVCARCCCRHGFAGRWGPAVSAHSILARLTLNHCAMTPRRPAEDAASPHHTPHHSSHTAPHTATPATQV